MCLYLPVAFRSLKADSLTFKLPEFVLSPPHLLPIF